MLTLIYNLPKFVPAYSFSTVLTFVVIPVGIDRYPITDIDTDNQNIKPIPIPIFSSVGYQTDTNTDNDRNTDISVNY